MPSKLKNLETNRFEVYVEKSAKCVETLFGIHRSEFMSCESRSIAPVVKARSWFYFILSEIYNVPRAQMVELRMNHLQSLGYYINKISESHDKKDKARLNKIYEILEL
jgi:hypothetical protein